MVFRRPENGSSTPLHGNPPRRWKPRRVLYLCPNPRRAGAEQVTALCIRHHDRARWEPSIYFFSDGPLVAEMRGEGVRCHLPEEGRERPRLRNPVSFLSEVGALRRLILSEKIELVHSVMGYAHLFGGPAARLAGVPELWFQHGPTGWLDWLTGRVPTHALLVNSRHTELRQARYHASARRIARVPLGVEPRPPLALPEGGPEGGPEIRSERQAEQARAIRSRFPEDTVVFSLIGRVTRAKGHLLLVEAAERVIREGERAGFVVVGAPFRGEDEAFLAELLAAIRERRLEPFFHFTGHLSPPDPALWASDALVSCSLAPEGFGLTLVEAMMQARPVIAPRAGGSIEIVSAPDTGLLYEPGSGPALAEALRRLIRLGARERERMGERGRERALAEFHVKRMVRDIEAEYEAILGLGDGTDQAASPETSESIARESG